MTPLRIRLVIDCVIAIAAAYETGSLFVGLALGSVALTFFAFHVRVDKALTVAEDYRRAIARMEHTQNEATKEAMQKSSEAHSRWTQMMDEAEKQMSGGGGNTMEDLMNELGIETDNEEDEEED